MANKKAGTFLVTSFQGGSGKTFATLELARKIHSKQGKPVAVIEMNIMRPSTLSSFIGDEITEKFTYLDYFKSNWGIFDVQTLKNKFYFSDGIYYIPFCGAEYNKTLKPGFQLNESDLFNSFNHLVKLMYDQGGYVLVDMLFQMSPLPIFMLTRADAILYLYSEQSPSAEFAEQFRFEVISEKINTEKLVWLRNYAEINSLSKNENLRPECILPFFDDEKTRLEYEASLNTLAIQLIKRNAMGSSTKLGVQDKDTETDELITYRRKRQLEVITDMEKRFGLSDVQLREVVEHKIDEVLVKNPPPESFGKNSKTEIKKFLLDEILGLGPLEDFMRDDDVNEIMVNGPDRIFVEKQGKLQLTTRQFANEQHVRTVIERILRPVGRTVNEKMPYVDARLQDGSRVHAIIPPLSLSGSMITIRKFAKVPYTMDDLVYRFKSATESVAEFLKLCVHLKRNIIVSGGASSGKTTLLNVLSNFISESERIITIEDSAELRLNKTNLGRLESRQQGTEARNQVTIRDLVRNALRMRPDRIIIGECRGGEAIDMLQAMNTGHDGSLTTLHANTSRDALTRLETMVLMGGLDLPLRAIREQIASSVNIIIQTGRLSDGRRTILEIVEVNGIDENVIKTTQIFKFEKHWIGEDGTVIGELLPTGNIPEFIKKMSSDVIEKYRRLFCSKESKELSNGKTTETTETTGKQEK